MDASKEAMEYEEEQERGDLIEDAETVDEPQNRVQGAKSTDMPNDDLIFNLSVDYAYIPKPDDIVS